MKGDWQATIIKIAAVVTAAPRWITSLMASEGLHLPDDWYIWWIPLSAIMAAFMAVVEGWAFAYIFSAWRNTQGKASKTLAGMAALTAGIFIIVVAPYIAASVRAVALSEILAADWSLYVWSAAVGASTIMIVASVGFAQKLPRETTSKPSAKTSNALAKASEPEPAKAALSCEICGKPAKTQNALNAHMRVHQRAASKNGHKVVA